MKTFFRRISAELCYVPAVPAWITAIVCLVFGLVVAVSGKGYGVFLPRTVFSVVFMGIFWGIFYVVIGFAFGCFLFSGYRYANSYKEQTAILFLCTLILSYAWTVVVCKAGNFFLGLLIGFSLIACLLTLFLVLRNTCLLSAILALSGNIWIFYVIYYTFSLMFFHL
jgi:tryptophan-rich sensory protein